ncbi:MAG TPA: hypothetical protein VM869_19270 [Enhygromyxa sp.]|jgi:hypothetical protein|nr:hypothetical protein [Enhygromyxa sp.]
MPCWYTTYNVGSDTYGSMIWAPQRRVADVCKRRRLGETLMSPMPQHPSSAWPGRVSTDLRKLADPRVRKRPRDVDVIHGLTWLLHLWCSAGCGSGAEASGDDGWFHDAVHLIAFGSAGYERDCGRPWRSVIERARDVESSVPGYLPSRFDLARMSARSRAWWE